MSKTTEYQIIMCGEVDDVVRIVGESIKDGWEPLGGVACGGHDEGSYFCQAMIRQPSSVPVPLVRK